MTTTITAGTLTVTITESLTLTDAGGNDHGVTATNSFTIDGISHVVKRVVAVPTSEVGLMSFASDLLTAPGTPQSTYVAGHYDEDTVRYIRITNKDDTNHITLIIRSTSGAEYAARVDAGRTFYLGCDDSGSTLAIDANGTALTLSMEGVADITAQADSSSCDVQVFVAST